MSAQSPARPPAAASEDGAEVEIEATLTDSAEERLQRLDFESTTAAEQADARRAIARRRLPVRPLTTRPTRPDRRGGQPDPRARLRRGGATIDLQSRARVERTPPLVVLCDISGSMAHYSRMFLHFLHVVGNDRERVHAFVLGTRLTPIRRYRRVRDVDEALARTGQAVTDRSGGTRIGECLRAFNVQWSRRLLGQGATALLVTDGLDREAGGGVAAEMVRLQRSARRLIRLNPLLRGSGFEARAGGARALRPYVDDFRPVHNIRNLVELAEAFADPARGERRRSA